MEKNDKLEEKINNREWKNKNSKYLFELQKFLDLAENIGEEDLQKMIINQMIKLDKAITNISEEIFEKIKS